MKKLSVLIIAMISLHLCDAQEVEFFKGTWQEANDLALQENKYIFVDAYTEWCGWCKVMDKKTFTDPAVISFLNENFIPMKIDFEDSLGIVLGMKFRVWAYPTTIVFNPMGQLAGKISGYNEDNSAYIDNLKKLMDIREERVYAFDSKELDLPYPGFYAKSFVKGKREWPKPETVSEYLKGQEDLFSEVNWSVILRFHPEDYLDFVVENLDEYSKRYGKEETDEIIQYYIYKIMQQAVKLTDPAELDKALALCDKLEDPDMYRFHILQSYHQQTKDWKAFADALGAYIENGHADEYMTINNYCWTIYENVEDQEILQKAAGWMKAVIEADPLWMSIDTYAALLYKTGSYDDALKYADMAIEAGEKAGEDVSGTRELKEKIEKAMKN